MKKILCISLIFLLMVAGFAQKKKSDKPSEPVQKHLLAILNYNAYSTDEQQPYIEFQFIIDGSTAQYIPASSDTYAAEIDIDDSVSVFILQRN